MKESTTSKKYGSGSNEILNNLIGVYITRVNDVTLSVWTDTHVPVVTDWQPVILSLYLWIRFRAENERASSLSLWFNCGLFQVNSCCFQFITVPFQVTIYRFQDPLLSAVCRAQVTRVQYENNPKNILLLVCVSINLYAHTDATWTA